MDYEGKRPYVNTYDQASGEAGYRFYVPMYMEDGTYSIQVTGSNGDLSDTTTPHFTVNTQTVDHFYTRILHQG